MIKINIDGPKGSGKSTLSRLFTEELNARHEYISYKHVYSVDDYVTMIRDADASRIQRDLIIERGPLSSWVYTWVRRGVMQCEEWTKPSTLDDFAEIVAELDLLVIMYASNHSDLFERIQKRCERDGIGVSQQEWDELKTTNDLFITLGEALENMRTDGLASKVYMIDISADDQVAPYQMFGDILEHLRSQDVTPVPRNDRG